MTQAVIDRGLAMSAPSLWQSLNAMVLVSRDLRRIFDDIDCLLTPILSSAPLPVGSFPTDHADTELHFERNGCLCADRCARQRLRFPAITLAFGTDADGCRCPSR